MYNISSKTHIVAYTHGAYDTLDWTKEVAEIGNPTIYYPTYYLVCSSWIFGRVFIERTGNGMGFCRTLLSYPTCSANLLKIAAATEPQTIIDMGCGIATPSIELAKLFPDAQLTLLDLSPYQLAAARHQAQHAGLAQRTTYLHASAEASGLPDASA